MTAKRCQFGEGKIDFARVLVEFEVSKGFKDKVEIQYRDKNNHKKGTKYVAVDYAWKPESCSHCSVFGHGPKECKKITRTEEEMAEDRKRKEDMEKRRNEQNVVNRRYKSRYEYQEVKTRGNTTTNNER